ncbi:hypothetical protein BDF19DRAFT_416313 [Syncephalis fuscata]|nr:hypothetical protein BDF19DRAFT_416313 [Syncephalis fuscata]
MPPLISVPSDSSANTPRPSLQLGSNNTSFLSFSEMLSPLNSAEWSTAPLCPPPRTPPPTLPASEASEQPATRTTTTRTTSPNNSRRQWSSIERQQFMASMEADRLVNSNDELAVLERPAINYQDGVSRESHSTLDDYFSQSEYDEDEDGEVAVATTQSFSSWTVQPVTPVKKKPSVSQSLNEERLYRVRSLRNARTANHINEFVRILITTLEEDTEILTGSNRPEPKTFPVTVHRGHTVEELTRIIEAEHAFIYGEPAPPPVPMRPLPLRSDTRVNAALPPNSANSAESSTGRRPSCSQPSPVYRAYRPLVCGQLFVGTVPLKYDDLIGEILDMNDVVRVINIYEEEITGEPHNNSAATSFVNLEASEANRSATALNKGGSSPKGDYNLCKVESNDTAGVRSYRSQPGGLEDRFRQCIYNEFALAAFQTHCAREFTLESLLFFLEIEVFRELAELEPSKLPPGVQLEHYARYIYEIYIDNDAPLQINISEEVREEVANTGNCWSGLFDEAQDMVQAMIKRHSFVRFETSDAHVLLTRLRQQGKAI